MKKRTTVQSKASPRFGPSDWQEAATLFGSLKEKKDEFAKRTQEMSGEMATALREGKKAVRDAERVLNGPGGEYQEDVERIVEQFVDALEE